MDGTLRQLGEKDLYLETVNHKILKFRLLAKTQFRDKEGESVRDSLLKPGDQLSLQVNGDDPETALRVREDLSTMIPPSCRWRRTPILQEAWRSRPSRRQDRGPTRAATTTR
jgi:hypothetical protein